MNVFVDANIIVSVLNKEYPLFSDSARILSLNGYKNINIHTSPICLAIAFYFSSKKSGEQLAKSKIKTLLNNIHLTTVNHATALQAIQNKKIHDFEDGMEYYSAIESNCSVIVTEDLNDYYFSDIKVQKAQDFLISVKQQFF